MTDPQRTLLPVPLQRLASLCRAAFDAEAPALEPKVDPAILHRWSMRHRVVGLAYKGAVRLGIADQYPALRGEALAVAQANLRLADQAFALRDALATAKVATMFVKGLAVAMRAYGDIATKVSADLDILVDEADLGAAAATLEALGYVRHLPRRSGLRHWHASHKESIWVRDGAAAVELHHRLADDPTLLVGLHPSEAVGIEIVDGERLPTIADEDLIPYLSVHGASSAWFRLKWLADYAAIRRQQLPVAPHPGTERAIRVADRLSNILFESGFPEHALARGDRLMVSIALQQLAAEAEPTERRGGTVPIHLNQALIGGGARFAWRDLARQWRAIRLRD